MYLAQQNSLQGLTLDEVNAKSATEKLAVTKSTPTISVTTTPTITLPTTQDETRQYTVYDFGQPTATKPVVSTIKPTTSTINGLSKDNFTYFSQKDPSFTSKEDGKTKMTLSKVGCGTTVTSMLMYNYTDTKLNPLQTRDKFFTHPNYTNSGFYYSAAEVPLEGYGFSFKDVSSHVGSSAIDEIAQATYEKPIVVGFHYKGAPSGHYVLAVGQDSSGTPLVYDPYHYSESGSQDPIPLNQDNFPGMSLGNADVIVVTPPGAEP
jgi:hypothetical protein